MRKEKSRFHRYRNVITVLGALLVFVTYVVKDAIRENIKDTVDSIQAADYQFFATSQNRAVFGLVTPLVLNVVQKDFKSSKNKSSKSREGSDTETVGTVAAAIGTYGAQVVMAAESLNMLVEKLPESETGLRKANDDIQKRRNWVFDLTKKLAPEMQKFASKPWDEDSIPEDLSNPMEDLGDEIEALGPDIDKLAKQAVTRLREIKKSEEERLKRYTHISYILYAVGWSLALFGRLVGIEGVEVG